MTESNRWRAWREFSEPIPRRNKAKPNQPRNTFNTHLKTVLSRISQSEERNILKGNRQKNSAYECEIGSSAIVSVSLPQRTIEDYFIAKLRITVIIPRASFPFLPQSSLFCRLHHPLAAASGWPASFSFSPCDPGRLCKQT